MADETCTSVNPDSGQFCSLSSATHSLHVAPGTSWTDKDVEDAKDPQKVMVKTIKEATRAMNRVADAIEHYMTEALHKVR
jgi:hypothetical protein